jgi:septum site-determining protein MinC
MFRFVADSARLRPLNPARWLTFLTTPCQPTNKTRQLIEFKGTTLPVVVVTLRSLHPDALAEAASALFGDDEFFDGDAALLELSQIADVPEPDWRRVKQVLKSHGLNVIGVRGGSEELRYSAAFAGLPTYAAGERSIPVPCQ